MGGVLCQNQEQETYGLNNSWAFPNIGNVGMGYFEEPIFTIGTIDSYSQETIFPQKKLPCRPLKEMFAIA